MKRRELLVGTSSLAALGAAGCLGTVGLDEYEASPAGVDPAVRDETGYAQTNVEEFVVERSVDVAGASETISVTNYLTEHEKAIDLGPLGSIRAAAFVVMTSPQISIAGREFNPIAEMSSEELIGLIEADFDQINNAEHVADEAVTILGQETTESLFEAEATFDGTTVDVNVHLSESVQTTNDHLVTIGVYPTRLERIEAENIGALMAGVVEDAE